MKIKTRCLRALATFIPLIIVLGIVYFRRIFPTHGKRTALNPKTLIPEYSSISRLEKDDRTIGPVSLQVSYSSWLNPIFEPLDRVFR